MKLPRPIKYAPEEGGNWIKWKDRWAHNKYPGVVAHTIVFDNGRAFDMLNGWRDGRRFRYNKKTGEQMRLPSRPRSVFT